MWLGDCGFEIGGLRIQDRILIGLRAKTREECSLPRFSLPKVRKEQQHSQILWRNEVAVSSRVTQQKPKEIQLISRNQREPLFFKSKQSLCKYRPSRKKVIKFVPNLGYTLGRRWENRLVQDWRGEDCESIRFLLKGESIFVHLNRGLLVVAEIYS